MLCHYLSSDFFVLTTPLAPTCPAPPATSAQTVYMMPWSYREILLERQHGRLEVVFSNQIAPLSPQIIQIKKMSTFLVLGDFELRDQLLKVVRAIKSNEKEPAGPERLPKFLGFMDHLAGLLLRQLSKPMVPSSGAIA